MEARRQRPASLIRVQSPLPEPDPQLLLNQGECDAPPHLAHWPQAVVGLWWGSGGALVDSAGIGHQPGSFLGGSGSHAEVLFKPKGLGLWRQRLRFFPFATRCLFLGD